MIAGMALTDSLPSSPEAITPEWLSIRLGGRVDAIAVQAVTDRTGINGEMSRLHLSGEGVPATVMAKFPAASEGARLVAAFQRWHEREVRFYRELAASTPLRSPRCYSAEFDVTGECVVLLEDLGRLRQGDQVASCSLEEAAAAIEAAAAMHARWWEPDPAPHPWLPLTTVGMDHTTLVQRTFARAWASVRPLLPEAARPIVDAGLEAYPSLLEEIARGPVTLCHGDYRLDNLFFDEEGVIAFDWQFACRARGAYDVAYFLALDLEPDVLARERDALLQRYVDALAAGGVAGYALERCRRDYAVSLILAAAVFTIGAAAPQPTESTCVMHKVGLHRLGAAIEAAAREGLL